MCQFFLYLSRLKGMSRYTGLLLAPAESFGLWVRLFGPSVKKSFLCCFGPFKAILGFSSYLSTIEKNPYNPRNWEKRYRELLQKYHLCVLFLLHWLFYRMPLIMVVFESGAEKRPCRQRLLTLVESLCYPNRAGA